MTFSGVVLHFLHSGPPISSIPDQIRLIAASASAPVNTKATDQPRKPYFIGLHIGLHIKFARDVEEVEGGVK